MREVGSSKKLLFAFVAVLVLFSFSFASAATGASTHQNFFQKFWNEFTAKLTGHVTSFDLTPRISYWQGKVNQHTEKGVWMTDSDGSSGAEIDKLTYCKKFYPNTVSVKSYDTETITDWRNAGNTGGPYTSTKQVYECVQGSSGSTNTSTSYTNSSGSSNNSSNLSCTDSDGGRNYYVRGVGKGIYAGGQVPGQIFGSNPNKEVGIIYTNSTNYTTFYDYCVDSNSSDQLNEAYCGSDGKLYAVGYSCPNGCSDGACISSNKTDLSSSESFLRPTYNNLPLCKNEQTVLAFCESKGFANGSEGSAWSGGKCSNYSNGVWGVDYNTAINVNCVGKSNKTNVGSSGNSVSATLNEGNSVRLSLGGKTYTIEAVSIYPTSPSGYGALFYVLGAYYPGFEGNYLSLSDGTSLYINKIIIKNNTNEGKTVKFALSLQGYTNTKECIIYNGTGVCPFRNESYKVSAAGCGPYGTDLNFSYGNAFESFKGVQQGVGIVTLKNGVKIELTGAPCAVYLDNLLFEDPNSLLTNSSQNLSVGNKAPKDVYNLYSGKSLKVGAHIISLISPSKSYSFVLNLTVDGKKISIPFQTPLGGASPVKMSVGGDELTIILQRVSYDSKGILDHAVLKIDGVSSSGNSVNTTCNNGCFSNGKCVSIGARVGDNYCSSEGKLVAQLNPNEKCESNFECSSNLCSGGICSDNTGTFQKILVFFRKIFGA